MRMGRVTLALVCLVAAASLACGCTLLGSKGAASTTASAKIDSASQAVGLARAQMQSVAVDAVPVMISSAGVAINPPPEQWQVLLASSATGRMYSVNTNNTAAEKPRDLGPLTLSADLVANAIPYDALKVGSDQAYAKAKAELAKTGPVPPHAMQSIELLEMPSLPNSTPAVWQVSFLNGTSTSGMRRADVDAMTGTVTVAK